MLLLRPSSGDGQAYLRRTFDQVDSNANQLTALLNVTCKWSIIFISMSRVSLRADGACLFFIPLLDLEWEKHQMRMNVAI